MEARARAGVGSEPGNGVPGDAGPGVRLGAGRLNRGLPQHARGIVMAGEVRAKQRAMIKQENFPCFPNGLAEPLGELLKL